MMKCSKSIFATWGADTTLGGFKNVWFSTIGMGSVLRGLNPPPSIVWRAREWMQASIVLKRPMTMGRQGSSWAGPFVPGFLEAMFHHWKGSIGDEYGWTSTWPGQGGANGLIYTSKVSPITEHLEWNVGTSPVRSGAHGFGGKME